MATNLDTLDLRLLHAIQRDATLTADQLADRCGTSSSTALRRINRLRAAGVIRAEVAIIEAASVGRPLLMLVNVTVKRGPKANTAAFKAMVLSHPAVMQFYFVTGSVDYVILLSLTSMDEYDEFIQAVLAVDSQLATDTNVVIRALKMSLAIPIGDTVPAVSQ